MAGRCKSCNAILEEWEMKTVDPLTGTYTELCDECVKDDLFEDNPWYSPVDELDDLYGDR